MGPKPNRPVRPRQCKFCFRHAPCLLQRHVFGEAFDVGLRRHAIKEREGGIPRFGNNTIRTLISWQIMGKCDKRIGTLRPFYRVDRVANAVGIYLERRSREHPPRGRHAAGQDPHEAETALVQRAQPFQAHHNIWRSALRICKRNVHGAPPKLSAMKRYQLFPMIAATSSSFIPTDFRPVSMFPKSRLSLNQSGIGGNPGAAAEPSP